MLRPSIALQMPLSGALSASAKEDPADEQRRRNFWSFLTWAFFLSEVFGPNGIMPTSARAAEDEDWQPADPSEQPSATGDSQQLPPGDIDAIMEPAAQTPPTLGTGPALQQTADIQWEASESPTPISVEARDGAPAVTGGSDSPANDGSIGEHGSAGMNGDSAGPDVDAHSLDLTDALPGVSISTPIAGLSVDLGGVVGAVLDPVTGIVDGLGDGLAQLPVVGGLLNGVTGTVSSLLGSDPESTSLAPAGGDGAALSLGSLLSVSLDGALASPGQLLFSETPEPASTTDIISGGQYTDYGIAMQTGLVEGAIDLTQSIGSGIGSITGVLADTSGDLHSGMFSIPDPDEVTISAMTDEIGLRVGGDALV